MILFSVFFFLSIQKLESFYIHVHQGKSAEALFFLLFLCCFAWGNDQSTWGLQFQLVFFTHFLPLILQNTTFFWPFLFCSTLVDCD